MTCLAWFLLFLAGLILFLFLFGPFIGGCLGLVIGGSLFRQAWKEAREEDDPPDESGSWRDE